jgi:hypothetical protein
MRAIFVVLGLLNVANGSWMLLLPQGWYQDLPAGVPDTGPLNTHFVRDLGGAFLTIGVALLCAAVRPAMRRPVLAFATLFYLLHAAIHVRDLVAGQLDADHWLIDLPGVFLPVLVMAVLCLPRFWTAASGRSAA